MRTKFLQQEKGIRHVIGLLLLVFAFTTSVLPVRAAQEYEVYEEQGMGTVTSETLNIRSGPGTDYDRVDEAAQGDILTITGQASNGWFRVSYEGNEGYVSGKYIILSQEGLSASGEEQAGETEDVTDTETGDAGLDKYISGRYTQYIKIAVIVLVISVILIMLIITIRGITGNGDDDEEDDYEDYEDYEPVRPVRQNQSVQISQAASKSVNAVKKQAPQKQTAQKQAPQKVFITEEDYRVHIDPIYFQDEKPIRQPDRIEESEEGSKTEDLKKAMEKLNELQEEIERLKNN